MELRRVIPDSRTSKDLDAVTRADMETVHERLSDAGEAGWEGFTATFTPPAPFEVPGQLVNPQRFTAKLSYFGKPFASVPIEVSAIEAGNAERYDKVSSKALPWSVSRQSGFLALSLWQRCRRLRRRAGWLGGLPPRL